MQAFPSSYKPSSAVVSPHYQDDPESDSFKAGTGWLKRFNDRYEIRALSVQGEYFSAAEESVAPIEITKDH